MNQELYHFGVKGMKWGVRRYQNKDGSLTKAGRKRISKEYKKESERVANELNKIGNRMYIDAYNKAANKMNSGEIDKFNASQKKKYGSNYTERDGYMEDYANVFNKELEKNFNTALANFYKSNKNYQRAQELVKEYDMTSWDELAKANAESIKTLSEYMKDN